MDSEEEAGGEVEEYTRWTGPASQNPGRRPTEDTDALPQAREAKSLGKQSSTRRASLSGRSTFVSVELLFAPIPVAVTG